MLRSEGERLHRRVRRELATLPYGPPPCTPHNKASESPVTVLHITLVGAQRPKYQSRKTSRRAGREADCRIADKAGQWGTRSSSGVEGGLSESHVRE